MQTQLDWKQAIEYYRAGGTLGTKLITAVKKGVYSAALFSVQKMQTSEINAADPPPVNKGVYRAGWRAQKLPNGAAYYNSVPYARYIEWGVPQENVVSSLKAIKAIAEWARVKFGGLEEKQALNVAYAIMASLKKKGIFKRGEGLKIMTKYNQTKLNAVIRREVTAEIDKLTA